MLVRSKVEMFFREFPFLVNFTAPDKVKTVKVLRVDEKLLATIPNRYSYPLISEDYFEQIILLDKNGLPLGEVKQWGRYPESTKGRLWRMIGLVENPRHQGESVADALHRLGEVTERIVYILSLEKETKVNSDYFRLVLYKPPKNFTLKEWIDSAVSRQQETLQKEIAEIDAEAEKPRS